jgi:hypothetical protein
MKPGQIQPLYLEPRLHKQSVKQEINNHGPLHTKQNKNVWRTIGPPSMTLLSNLPKICPRRSNEFQKLWLRWQLCLQHYFDNVDNCVYSITLTMLTIVFTALLWQCWQLCLQHYVDNCVYSITLTMLTIVFTALLWQCWQLCLQHYVDNCVYSITLTMLTIVFTALHWQCWQLCLQHYIDNVDNCVYSITLTMLTTVFTALLWQCWQ